MRGEAPAPAAHWEEQIRQWRQGDFTQDARQILLASDFQNDEFKAIPDDAEGLVVLSQTCDVVNASREWVVVAPIVEPEEAQRPNIKRGTTLAYARLDGLPENLAVDLGRMATIHKSVLARFKRKAGLHSDESRAHFADVLARKFARFAFPDDINEALFLPLRKRVLKYHKNEENPEGKAFRSLREIRVRAAPSWDAPDSVKISFLFVLETKEKRQLPRREVLEVLEGIVADVTAIRKWAKPLPERYTFEDPPYTLATLEELSAHDWVASQNLDLNYLSLPAWPTENPGSQP